MTENTPDRSPDDGMDPDKEARQLLNPPNESVQFSQNPTSTNGQVVLPNPKSSGVGMSKAELMKYANDPFWVRLRLFLFILFWVVWAAMLVGAVLIIAFAPGCPATASLPWYKKSALVQVDLNSEGSPKERVSRLASDLETFTKNLTVIKETGMTGVLLTGLDPFLLANLDNTTETQTEVDKFKAALVEFVTAVHSDDLKAKVIVGLRLSDTSITHPWFNQSKNVQADSNNTYLWVSEQVKNKLNVASLVWGYDPDRLQFYGRTNEKSALLNYGDHQTRDKLKEIVLTWVRTKVDGIEVDADLWAQTGADRVNVSSEAFLNLHKWVKSGGDNKALLVSDSRLAPELTAQGEDVATFEMASDTGLWKRLSQAANLKQELISVLKQYQTEQAAAAVTANTTGDAVKVNVGQGWKSLPVQFPTNQLNSIAQKYDKHVAEAVLVAFHLLPKSTPVVRIDGTVSEQLTKLQTSKLLTELTKLRKLHSESFLLGTVRLPEVLDSTEVVAVATAYKDKNTFVLLVNFGDTSAEVQVKGDGLPDLTKSTAKVVLASSDLLNTIGQSVDFSKVKIDPKRFVLIEIAPKE